MPTLFLCFVDVLRCFSPRQLNLFTSPLYIGGLREVARALTHPGGQIQTDDFIGCMRNVFINGMELDPSIAHKSFGVSDRCPRRDHCSSQPCQHGGKCVDYWFEYICECTEGYSGRSCEEGELLLDRRVDRPIHAQFYLSPLSKYLCFVFPISCAARTV